MADEEKLINVILKYSQEGISETKEAQQALDDVTYAMEKNALKAEKERKDAIAARALAIKQLSEDQKISIRTYLNGLEEERRAEEEHNKQLQAKKRELQELKSSARDFSQISMAVAGVGTAMVAGIMAEAQNYVSAVGITTQASAEWIAAQKSMEQSNLEFGKSAQEAALPAMKLAAELLRQLAGIVKENPWMMEGAMAVGGTLAVVGTLGTIVAQVTRLVAEAAALAVKMGIGTAAAQAGAAGATGTAAGAGAGATAVGAGTVAAVAIGAAAVQYVEAGLAKESAKKLGEITGDEKTAKKIVDGLAFILTGGIYPLFDGIRDKVEEVQNSVNNNENTNITPIITQAQTQAFINYQKQIAQAEEQYGQQRVDTVEKFGQQITTSEERYAERRANIIETFEENQLQTAQDRALNAARQLRDFNEQQAQAQNTYNEQKSKAVEQNNLAEERAAQQHAIELQRIDSEHNDKQYELLAERDALGLVKEQQAYEKRKAEANQDYTLQEQERKQNLAIQLRDMRQNFIEQRNEQRKQYEQRIADELERQQLEDKRAVERRDKQLAELDEQHKKEIKKLQDNLYETLTKLDQGYAAQQSKLRQAFANQLQDLDYFMGKDRELRSAYYAAETADLQNWINNNRALLTTTATGGSTTTTTPIYTGTTGYYRANGGFTSGDTIVGENGPELVHVPNGSYVYNNTEMRAMAAALSGRGVGSSSAGSNLTLNFNLSNGSQVSEVRKIVASTKSEIISEISNALETLSQGGYGA